MNKHLTVKQFNEIKRTFNESAHGELVRTVNARIVHGWLGVKTPYSRWIKRRIEKYDFQEDIDYCVTNARSGKALNSNDFSSTDYHLSPDCIKQLAMVESSEMGRIARLYFLDCETRAQEKAAEIANRQDMKVEFRPMTDAIKCAHDNPQGYHYSNESDMINRIVLGMTASKFRAYHDMDKKDSVRDYMTQAQMEAVIDLQRANTVFIKMGESFHERQAKLKSMFEKCHNQALIEEFKTLEA